MASKPDGLVLDLGIILRNLVFQQTHVSWLKAQNPSEAGMVTAAKDGKTLNPLCWFARGFFQTVYRMKQMEELRWWHRMKLPDGRITPGICYHGPDEDQDSWITGRFGLPENLKDKSVLDIGCSDGLFTFEAERRGASHVTAVEGFDKTGNNSDIETFLYAHNAFNSSAHLEAVDFMDYNPDHLYDVVLFYGVLYHVEDPIAAAKKLFSFAKVMGEVLIETAVMNWFEPKPIFQFEPGHDGDETNFFYPNYSALVKLFQHVGFYSVEPVHLLQSQTRATVRLVK